MLCSLSISNTPSQFPASSVHPGGPCEKINHRRKWDRRIHPCLHTALLFSSSTSSRSPETPESRITQNLDLCVDSFLDATCDMRHVRHTKWYRWYPSFVLDGVLIQPIISRNHLTSDNKKSSSCTLSLCISRLFLDFLLYE